MSWWPPDVSSSDGSPPNVDDMLAWLVSKTNDIDVNYKRTTREWFVYVGISDGDGYHEPREDILSDEYYGETLSAACELAVRAVDPFVQ